MKKASLVRHTKAVRQQWQQHKWQGINAAQAEDFTHAPLSPQPSPLLCSGLQLSPHLHALTCLCTPKPVWHHSWRTPLQGTFNDRASVMGRLWDFQEFPWPWVRWQGQLWGSAHGEAHGTSRHSEPLVDFSLQFLSLRFTLTNGMWSQVAHGHCPCKGADGLPSSPRSEEASSAPAASAWLPGNSSPWLWFWLKGNLEIFFFLNWSVI